MLKDILYLVVGLIAGFAIGFFVARNVMKKYDLDVEYKEKKQA